MATAKDSQPASSNQQNTVPKSPSVQITSSVQVKPEFSLPEIELCSTPQFDPTVEPEMPTDEVSIGKSHVFDLNIMHKIQKDDDDENLQGINLGKYLTIPTESFPIKCRHHHREFLNTKSRLSPINLDINEAVLAKFVNLSFDGYSLVPSTMKVVESKDSVKLYIDYGTKERPAIFGGPLLSRYILEEIDFYCSLDNYGGSEHTYFNHAFVMEMHVIHRREDLRIEHALKQNDGLAILSYFLVLDTEDNPCLHNILSKASDLKSFIDVFPLDHLIPLEEKNFFTYSGSLTTPPYTECVTWLIMTSGIGISQAQLDVFKEVAKVNGHIENVHRRTYGLNGRPLFFATDI